MQTLFIADLHLSDYTPDLNVLFTQFLRNHAQSADALYILGDLFDAWTGDDDDSVTAAEVAQAIKQFAQHAPVYFIAGNRDFLLGKSYADKANLTLLPENHIIHAHGKTLLLTHGDEMCTEDTSYLRYRKIMRCKIVQKYYSRCRIANASKSPKIYAPPVSAKSKTRKPMLFQT